MLQHVSTHRRHWKLSRWRWRTLHLCFEHFKNKFTIFVGVVRISLRQQWTVVVNGSCRGWNFYDDGVLITDLSFNACLSIKETHRSTFFVSMAKPVDLANRKKTQLKYWKYALYSITTLKMGNTASKWKHSKLNNWTYFYNSEETRFSVARESIEILFDVLVCGFVLILDLILIRIHVGDLLCWCCIFSRFIVTYANEARKS